MKTWLVLLLIAFALIAGYKFSGYQHQLSESNEGSLSLNLSTLSPSQTLYTSTLAVLELRKRKPIEIKELFCIEMKALALKYSQPDRIVSFSEMLKKVLMNNMKERRRKEQVHKFISMYSE